jgi:hypothetical protein
MDFENPAIGIHMPRSRFRLNGMAGSQKRAIHEPEGRDESRYSLISKK